jgi:hypothetical protein
MVDVSYEGSLWVWFLYVFKIRKKKIVIVSVYDITIYENTSSYTESSIMFV